MQRKSGGRLHVAPKHRMGAVDGDLVEYRLSPKRLASARITERIGAPASLPSLSDIAARAYGMPDAFPEEALREAESPPDFAGGRREDLRGIGFVTIDPADARDRDDAIHAAPDADPANAGGHVLHVAIADVAHYVRPDSALDRAARERGNSTYFPDRVIPMLPEALSAGACSLHPQADRPCLAVRIVIDGNGGKVSHRFARGVMRSRAALHYRQAQAAADGEGSVLPDEVAPDAIAALWKAYRALCKARDKRAPLDLDLPERRVALSGDGRMTGIETVARLDSHRLVEEFMILANVCAAETLEERKCPHLLRIHEHPERDRLRELSRALQSAGISLSLGETVTTKKLNALIGRATSEEMREFIGIAVLRSMNQARYSERRGGHFGLNLQRYAHFTSPIRRYADLAVHRALIGTLDLGPGGTPAGDSEPLGPVADHISATERRSVAAERETVDRHAAAFLSGRVGRKFTGSVTGAVRSAAFVRLDEIGAEGVISARDLGDGEYFRFDADANCLIGERSGTRYGIGTRVSVRLLAADVATGGLRFRIADSDDSAPPGTRSRSRHRTGPPRRRGQRR